MISTFLNHIYFLYLMFPQFLIMDWVFDEICGKIKYALILASFVVIFSELVILVTSAVIHVY